MKRIFFCFIMIVILFLAAGPVYADETLRNPSVFSAGEMVPDLPSLWGADNAKIKAYLNDYPDYQCDYYPYELEIGTYDQIVCKSVNNPRTRDITINFFITGDPGAAAGLQNVVFTISTPNSADIQEVFEALWLPEARPGHNSADEFYDPMASIIYYTENTMIRYNLPVYQTRGLDYMTVEIWDVYAKARVRD